MSEPLDTERLLLAPIATTDVELLIELDSDPAVMRYLTGGRPTSQAQAIAAVNDSLGHRWIARERATNAFVGWFGLRPTNPLEAEIGYRLRQQFWGHGYATEGSRRLLALGFGQGLDRIWGQTMTVNIASRRVMEAIGMRYVRTMHLDWPDVIDGSEEGDVEYEIRRAQ